MKNFLENLLYSKGKISAKRTYTLMLFVNAIVLCYLDGSTEIIKTFLSTGVIMSGIIGAEKVLHKPKKEEGKEDEK